MKYFPKMAMVGRWEPGTWPVQVVLKMKDVLGSMAEINRILSSLGVDLRQSAAYAAGDEGYGFYSTFVDLKDPKMTPEKLAAELMKSPMVVRAYAAAGRESGVVNTLTFPVMWGNRRLVYMSQPGLASILQIVIV